MTALERFQSAARKRYSDTSDLTLQPSIEAELILVVIDQVLEELIALRAKMRGDEA